MNIPQGAIVFNHVQTEELLSNGFTASRAVALASGTSPDISGKAFVSGNAMVTGGISVKQAQKSVISGGNTAKATNATNADTKATQSHTKATNDSTKATKKSKKTLDWVAERLKTWEKKVKKFSDQVTDFISSAFKTSLLKKQMKTMSKEISSNSKGELAYMKKANSVAKNYTYYDSDGDEINVSIPKKYQRLVQSGAYRVEDMDTSTDEGKALAGLLTESGALAITLDVDDINASTENLKTYIKERQQIINDYNAGKFGEDEYNQKLKDIDENIKSTTANIYSSRNSILELVKSQSQAELDVLNKVIDKRKEALSAKKSYYDYDKTLKNKTKDIEVLERQIAALEGSTSAEDKARKAKLQEQLQSAKDDLNDTITDHAYSMQTDALDKLSTDMSEDLDKWINTISSNMEEMTTAINDAVKNAGLSTAGTINAISSILRHYGLSDSEISQSGLSDIKGYASGTDYVPKSGMYRVNEKGMESVFSKQYGTLTFLSQGDKVFTADFTKQLLDNSTIATQKNMPDYAGMAKAIEKNIQNIQNLSGNTYVNNFYIDGAQDTESILREIDKHLDKKIQAHDKKQVRDFKSLR